MRLRGGILTIYVLLQVGCANPPVKPASETSALPTHAFQSSDPNHITIAVVGLNDFHGTLIPKERKLSNGTVVKSGGASPLFQMVSILRKEMRGNVLVVDAGDEWQGTLESNESKGKNVVDFYNRLGVSIAAIGNHEFDFDLSNMNHRFEEAKFPYVAANIFEKKTGKRPRWKNVYPSRMLAVGGVRFGVIGVSAQNTPGTTRYEYVQHLNFIESSGVVTELSEKLRKDGANAVLVTAHAGTRCEETGSARDWRLWSVNSEQVECDREGEIAQLALKVKPGTLDGIVSGHVHHVTHHFFNGIPVVQDEAYNQHFNIIYYTFDRKTRRLIPELTRIEGLIPICTQFFEGTQHCDVRRLSDGSTPTLVPAVFHGVKVVGDSKVDAWLDEIRASTEKYRKDVLGEAHHALTHLRWKESAFDNWVAQVLREKANADFGVVNLGGTRTAIDAGPITYDMLFRALPFENYLNVLILTGAEMKQMIQIMTSGAHDGIGLDGFKVTMLPYEDDQAPGKDLNQNGTIERWEFNRLIGLTRSDGTPIEDQKMYTVATYDYLVNGGDHLSWFMSKIPADRIKRGFPGFTRDHVAEALKREKVVNTEEKPFYDPENPRIIFKK